MKYFILAQTDTKGHKVLFAEASKEAVDFLFTLLSLPVATVIRLLSDQDGMVGCLGKLYQSVENLDDMHKEPDFNKDTFLMPRATIVGADILGVNFTICESCSCHFVGENCQLCEGESESSTVFSTTTLPTEEACRKKGGYVKDGVTYMIMDDLEVKPMTTVSVVDVLKYLGVKQVGALEEKVVYLGREEGMKLVKDSLESDSVLSNVFLDQSFKVGDLMLELAPVGWILVLVLVFYVILYFKS